MHTQKVYRFFSFVNSRGVYPVLVQLAWQATYNQIFRVRLVIIRIYVQECNRIPVEEPELEKDLYQIILGIGKIMYELPNESTACLIFPSSP
jgi:hypothetical protein